MNCWVLILYMLAALAASLLVGCAFGWFVRWVERDEER